MNIRIHKKSSCKKKYVQRIGLARNEVHCLDEAFLTNFLGLTVDLEHNGQNKAGYYDK